MTVGISATSYEVLEPMANRLRLPVRELFDFRKAMRPLSQ